MKKKFSLIILLMLSLCVAISGSSAADVVINNSTSSGIDGSLGNDTISLVNGTYSGVNNTNLTIHNGRNITIQSNNPNNKAIIDCNGSWFIYNSGRLSLKNLIIKNAYIQGSGTVVSNTGNLTIINCTFINNSALHSAGVVYNNNGIINISCSIFTNNSAGFYGGVIYNEDGIIDISGSIFTNNSAGFYGGVIYSHVTPPEFLPEIPIDQLDLNFIVRSTSADPLVLLYRINVFNCTLTNNKAQKGGAIYNIGGDSSIGGIDYYGLGNLTIRTTNFVNNSADEYGNAIYNDIGFLNMSYSRILNNTGGYLAIYAGYGLIDFNWWGDNTPEIDVDYFGLTLSNWFVANLTSKNSTVVRGSNVVLDYSFTLNEGSVVDNSLLPYFVVVEGKVFDARFNKSINYNVQSMNVNGFVDNQPLQVTFNENNSTNNHNNTNTTNITNNTNNTNTNNNTNNVVGNAVSMKSTGIPVFVLLIASLLAFVPFYRRKN
ncbi:MAG: hypothetical protein ACRCVG_06050 [Methanobacteriaceae archaeon]